MRLTRWRRMSPANSGPNLFHQSLTVSWQMSIPRSNSRSPTFRRLQRKADVHEHDQPDHLGRRVEAAKRARRQRPRLPAHTPPVSAPCPACHVGLTEPPPSVPDRRSSLINVRAYACVTGHEPASLSRYRLRFRRAVVARVVQLHGNNLGLEAKFALKNLGLQL